MCTRCTAVATSWWVWCGRVDPPRDLQGKWKKPKRTGPGRDGRIQSVNVIEVDRMCDGDIAALYLGLATAALGVLGALLQVGVAWLHLRYLVREEGSRRWT